MLARFAVVCYCVKSILSLGFRVINCVCLLSLLPQTNHIPVVDIKWLIESLIKGEKLDKTDNAYLYRVRKSNK